MKVVNAVVVPMIRMEIPSLVTWIRYCPASGKKGCQLLLSLDTKWEAADRARVQDTFSRSALALEDWTIEFLDCGMTVEESFYIKNPKQEIDLERFPYGLKSGPNKQFFTTLRLLQTQAQRIGAVLLMETDAFPLYDGWLERLNQYMERTASNALVAGPRYAGASKMSPHISLHFNGNSVYCIGTADFYEFLDDWDHLLRETLRIARHQAYDCVIPWFMNYRSIHPGVRKMSERISPTLGERFTKRCFDLSECLVNYGGEVENANGYRLDVIRFLEKHPEATIVHGKCFMLDVHRLREAKANAARKHLVNVAVDLVNSGQYEKAMRFGLTKARIALAAAQNIDRLSEMDVSMIQRAWKGSQASA